MRPEILGAEYKLKGAEYDLAIAKGGRSPQLSVGASWNTAYSDDTGSTLLPWNPMISGHSWILTGTVQLVFR